MAPSLVCSSCSGRGAECVVRKDVDDDCAVGALVDVLGELLGGDVAGVIVGAVMCEADGQRALCVGSTHTRHGHRAGETGEGL